ncbi:hypothetical protein N7516_008725 [Penicillium verrucosum]|uniref:uncharacterized protein n=1 Tax=Penicillium verrucosum TaxID=60171 RepID=UPI002544F17C|nr:uncharacterized protein N7516_008725 [Penicillium verrucosum]KAJ5926952.1 hypothetical protein N7516_008725 [Penicillium verrucosum]
MLPTNSICMFGPLNTHQEYEPAPGRFEDYIISQGLATWQRSYHLRVQRANYAIPSTTRQLLGGWTIYDLLGAGNDGTTNTICMVGPLNTQEHDPAPGRSEDYIFS